MTGDGTQVDTSGGRCYDGHCMSVIALSVITCLACICYTFLMACGNEPGPGLLAVAGATAGALASRRPTNPTNGHV